MIDDKRVHLKIALADLEVKHDRLKKKNEELRQGIISDRDDVVCIRKDVYDTLKASHAKLVEIIETAISQHHRVAPNTIMDGVDRKYQALKEAQEI